MTTELTIRKMPIVPSDVWNPSDQTIGINHPLPVIPGVKVRTWNPFPAMRSMGYTRNPDTCLHERKQYYSGKWSCSLCGDRL